MPVLASISVSVPQFRKEECPGKENKIIDNGTNMQYNSMVTTLNKILVNNLTVLFNKKTQEEASKRDISTM